MAAGADIELAGVWGVSPVTVGALAKEHLLEGEDFGWEGEGGHRRKVYTEAGRTKLELLVLGACGKESPKEGLNGKEERKKEEELPVALKVLRIYPNATWIAVVTGPGASADVQVRDNRVLRVGQMLPCRVAEGRWYCVEARMAPHPGGIRPLP